MNIKKHTYQVGDDVSYGFNGDWYPVGKVTRITERFLFTDSGMKFTKYVQNLWSPVSEDEYADVPTEIFRATGSRSWVLVKGIHREKNPHV